ncbi:Hypothetical protein CpOVI2C_01004 [Corynebacterium pseudotuberculosis]|nr:hypothetical protein CPTA_02212 [Corynebacterium pseudotuberculosis]AIG09598.1 hypothetical protein CPTB_01542 [Corynebacterium pseudotuberculosis]AIG12499.1 hypothetical protein CPTC_02211 [Corynebacterium pseudotuberculosis]AQL51730.1 hypothetical protein CpPA04_1638 [Corynebacterium pseudotuberculosis]AUY07006.1 Hypothetical protein CpOVI2C_01004 [Corynebacterium pseudotuberculosis]
MRSDAPQALLTGFSDQPSGAEGHQLAQGASNNRCRCD